MKNYEEEIQELLDSTTGDSIIKQCEEELEHNKILYLDLKRKLLEWQASCIRAELAIECIKFKRKDDKIWHEFYKKKKD